MKFKTQNQGGAVPENVLVFEFMILNLFRISDFGFRASSRTRRARMLHAENLTKFVLSIT